MMASSECRGACADSVCDADLRIVLLGRTGSGKSSTGNSILGTPAFRTDASALSVTRQCVRACGVVEGRSLQVVDTPGFFHTCMSGEEVCAEVARGMADLSAPGPHALLLVLEVGRVTPEQRSTLNWICNVLGPDALAHTLLVLTRSEELAQKPLEIYLQESKELWEFAGLCDGRVQALDNGKGEESEQGVELVKKIEGMVLRNGGAWYSCGQRILGERGGREEEDEKEKRKRAEREFWCELVTAMGKGAIESSGIMEKGKGKGQKSKIAHRAAALASTPLTVTSAVKIVGGAVKEGTKVLYKHKKSLLQ